ncbi:MAG TPA: hypothetical protein VGO78_03220 [Acidimicrobiales bacterium]|nr:hypothetical protein [Acidimicrobiales bacterium]
MDWLTSLPAGVLVAGWLAFALLVAAGARLAVRAVVPDDEHDQVQQVAAPLMPALGAAFGVLIALTLASEAGYLRSAQDIVADEAASSSRLAWAATSPGVDTAPVHAALGDYLRATRATEWRGAAATGAGRDARVAGAIAALEHEVRTEAARPELGTPSSTELLASLDGVTSDRRQRIAAASRQIPVLYVLTLVVGGAALVANAGALGVGSRARTSLLVVGLAVVVGLSLALLFSLAAPWRGPLVVSGHPLDAVVHDLDTNYFTAA